MSIEESIKSNTMMRLLTQEQRRIRTERNSTDKVMEKKCLHQAFLNWAHQNPNQVALIYEGFGERKEMTYGELRDRSLRCAAMLREKGVQKGNLVATIQLRGVNQMVSLLAILIAGGVYVPINARHPLGRIESICLNGEISYILTDKEVATKWQQPMTQHILHIEEAMSFEQATEVVEDIQQLAYVIFTSGSTGKPKGVMITHEAAWNTIQDMNERFEIDETDCGIQLSELDFDLSVYDVFGILAAGGRLVLLNEKNRREPTIWHQLVMENRVTVWNSVPAIYEMFMSVASSKKEILPLKKFFLSGDWIPLNLYEMAQTWSPKARFIALGGATEASIWSNYYEVNQIETTWKSIPYGEPLANQKLRVVNEEGLDVPDGEAGELWIGGMGVAEGYLNQEELTKNVFINIGQERWYKTGDLATYRSDGLVEILGRIDYQVKVNGYRIELGEIEKQLEKLPEIAQAVVVVVQQNKICAAIMPEKITQTCMTDSEKEDSTIFKEEDIEKRKCQVEYCLIKLLKLDTPSEFPVPLSKWTKCNEAWKLWIDFLIQREVIQVQDACVLEGKRYKQIINISLELLKTVEQYIKSLDLLSQVFYQKEEAIKLLEDPLWMPESLSLQGLEATYFLDQMANIYKNTEVLKIAILNARSGLVAEAICERLPQAQVNLLDTSQALLLQAKKRLETKNIQAEYIQIDEGLIRKDDYAAFDIVVSLNTLHTWEAPERALEYSEALLHEGGMLWALEFEEMDPMGLLNSPLLENGFSQNGESHMPFLAMHKWQKYLQNSAFTSAKVQSITHTRAMIIKAHLTHAKKLSDMMYLNSQLKESLANYMMPQEYSIALWYPLTDNGKIDRKRIQEIFLRDELPSEGVREEELSDTEQQVYSIWKEFLPVHSIRKNHSFFALGGDSLLATKVLVKMQQVFGVEMTLVEMLEKNTIETMAQLINEKQEKMGEIFEGEI